MPRKGKRNISAEGQDLLEDKEIWGNETALRGAIYDSRKRERSNKDGLFMPHQKGPITSTFTADWFLREGQGRELLGEWMKTTSVRSQDQRRMLQANSHTFPTNSWIHRITKLGAKNPTDATYVGSSESGYRKSGSGRRRSFRNKLWVISNIPVKPYQQHTLTPIISADD